MKWEWWVVALALAAGVMMRLPQLDLRPMHTDEAVHAVKFGSLLEVGTYRYDRNEYHGPTLNYFTLLPAWLASQARLVEVTEYTLRIVPVFFGIGLIVLLLWVWDIGPWPAAMAALFTAISPAMVFYSRYYIQEILLVFFAFGLIVAAYRFIVVKRIRWSIVAGMCAGLMFATKETWMISFGAMGCAFLAVLLFRHSGGWAKCRGYTRGILIALLSGTVVAVLFFSSFFTHWEGVRDSLLASQTYFGRAVGESRHGHPWDYFLRLLTYRQGHDMSWTEAGIVLFGAIGIVNAFREKRTPAGSGKDLRAFLGLYSCLMLFILSAIPYKTPWLVIGVLQPLIVTAGCGASAFVGWLPRRLRVLGVMTIALFAGHLAWQAYTANFRLYDDPANPYVYSHPTDDVRQIAAELESIRRNSPDGLVVQVVCPGDDYWPLPWYLRALPDVGWWNSVAEEFVATPVILASPDVEPELMERLYDAPPPGERPLYIPLFDRPMYLRPGRELRGYIRLDLHEKLLKERAG
jgi:uncharacterized protein (TIGR03663 family)